MNADKKELRREMRLKEALLSGEDALEFSQDIWRQIELLSEFNAASTILIYMSLAGEVQTPPFIEKWASTKRMVIPLVCGDHLELKAYDPLHLREGYRHIQEPTPDAVQVSPREIELAIVPGVAFSRCGAKIKRLGRGGGFYDRLLPQLSCPKIGVAFSFRQVEEIPADVWDEELDRLVVNNVSD